MNVLSSNSFMDEIGQEKKTTKDQNTFESYNNNDSNIQKCLVDHKYLDILFKNTYTLVKSEKEKRIK